VVLDLREDYPEMEKGAYRRLSSRLFNSIEKIERIQRDACAAADLVLVTTPMFIDVLSERYPEVPREKFVLVGNYADVASIEAIMATDGEVKEGDTFTITYVGSVGTPERGLQVTIEAMPRIRRSIPGAKLLIVGDGGYLPMLRKQVADLGLDDVVEFRGWVDFTEVPGIIQRSTVCTVPSLNVSYECEMTLPHKLFQYMLLSRPVVVGDCHELMRVVEGSGAGLAFKAGDAADFAEKVISLKDPDLRRSMGRKGREAVLNEYNFTASARRLVELFRELGAEKPD
jgi:glycosyltransferase involved in cell wall biosynthesis